MNLAVKTPRTRRKKTSDLGGLGVLAVRILGVVVLVATLAQSLVFLTAWPASSPSAGG